MNKTFSLIMALVLTTSIVALAACATPTAAPTPAPAAAPTKAPAAAQKATIAVCLPALDNPLMLALRDAFVNTFGDKYDVQVASADGNPNTQATQVENYTAMKVKFMFVMAVEASSLLPQLGEGPGGRRLGHGGGRRAGQIGT